MTMYFTVPIEGQNYLHILLPNGMKCQKIVYEGFIVLNIWKQHNHNYELAGFIYKRHKIIYPRQYKTKKELYGAIQKLLQEEL